MHVKGFRLKGGTFSMGHNVLNTGRIKKLAGLDQHSLEAKPMFVAPDCGDFRLKPGSPGTAAADDGIPVGARP